MKYTEILEFLPPEQLQEKVKGIFEKEKWMIESHFPNTDIQNVGSSAIPGAMGKYDVDIQIRVSQEDFNDVVTFMKGYAEPKNFETWTEQYALFKDSRDIIDYNVTVIDSKHDFFYKMRDHFIANPVILEEYMELKRQNNGKPYGDYRSIRYAFLKKIRNSLT